MSDQFTYEDVPPVETDAERMDRIDHAVLSGRLDRSGAMTRGCLYDQIQEGLARVEARGEWPRLEWESPYLPAPKYEKQKGEE